MEKREEIIIEKYKKAEQLRKQRDIWRKKSYEDKYKDQINEMRRIEKVAELEVETKIAWKFKESRQAINLQKKLLDGKIQAEILKLKIKQDLFNQSKKFVRSEKPSKPKKDPLPYLRKNRTVIHSSSSEEDSTEIAQVSVPKREMHFRINNATPNPFQKVKLKYHLRHISPQLQRNQY